MEFSITGRGGSTPFHTFLFIYFLTVKWQFSVNFEFFLVFCLQIKPSIPSHSIPFLSNPIILNTIIPLYPWSQILWIVSKNNGNLSLGCWKKIINKFHTLPHRRGGVKKVWKIPYFFFILFLRPSLICVCIIFHSCQNYL